MRYLSSDVCSFYLSLRMQRRSWTAVTRPSQAEDAVDVETWSQVGDERLPAEGAERGVTVIGTGGMYPEIENALVGMAKGDEKTVDVTFPDRKSTRLNSSH